MVGKHLRRLVLYRHLCALFQICLNEWRQLVVSLFLALKHHSRILESRQDLLPSVDSTVFITHHEHSRLCRFFQITLQLVPVFYVLRLLHYYHLPLCHHGIAPRHVCHLGSRHIGSEHYLLVEISLFGLYRMLRNEVCNLVDVVSLLPHQQIRRCVVAGLQTRHHALKSHCRCFLSHTIFFNYFIHYQFRCNIFLFV